MRTSSQFTYTAYKNATKGPATKLPGRKRHASAACVVRTGPTVRNLEVVSDAKMARLKSELFERVSPATLEGFLNSSTALVRSSLSPSSSDSPASRPTAHTTILLDLRPREEYLASKIVGGLLISFLPGGPLHKSRQISVRNSPSRKMIRRTSQRLVSFFTIEMIRQDSRLRTSSQKKVGRISITSLEGSRQSFALDLV